MAECRACKAEIQWARNVDTQKGVPLDPDPVPGGNVYVVADDQVPEGLLRSGEWPVRVLRKDQPALDLGDGPTYVTHFATCPNADEFRSPPSHRGARRGR